MPAAAPAHGGIAAGVEYGVVEFQHGQVGSHGPAAGNQNTDKSVISVKRCKA